MQSTRRLPLVACLCLMLGAGCVPSLPTGTTGNKPKPGESKKPSASPSVASSTAPSASPSTGTASPSPSPSTSLTTGGVPTGFFSAQVLGLDGKPAVDVAIKSYVIATGGGNVISTGGGNVISTGGGNVISTGGGNYVLLQATEVKTDAAGKFYFKPLTDGNKLTVEAVQSATVKAMQLDIGAQSGDFTMKLAKTGSISGKVSAPEAPSVTNFENVDVFVPGTSYAAKTDAAGNFTISNLPVGTFNLVASKDNLGRANANGVVVESEKTTAVSSLPLSIKAPLLTKLTPEIGGPGVEVTITGDNFGASEGKTFQVTFGGVIAASPTRVDDKTIKVKVPGTVANGDVIVTVGGVASSGSAFKVIKDLTLSANPAELVKGKSYAFKVSGRDSAENALVNPPVTWSVEGAGLTVDAAGNVKGTTVGSGKVIATSGTKVVSMDITVVASQYVVTTFAGGPGSAMGYPEYLAFGPDDNLYVSDSTKHVIHKISPAGAITTFAGSTKGYAEGQGTGAKFDTPQGIGFDGNGNLFVADRGNHRIRKVTSDGSVSTVLGDGFETYATLDEALGEAPGKCARPYALKVDSANNVYFTQDGGGHRQAVRLSPTREVALLRTPNVPNNASVMPMVWSDLVMNGATLIVPENESGVGSGRIYKVLNGTATLFAGGTGFNEALDGTGPGAGFGQIQGIGLDNDGNYFVSDVSSKTGAHLIRKITADGVVTTIAGGTFGEDDGPGKAARFDSPADITLGPDGALYVCDRAKARIRKLTLVVGE